MPIDVTPATTRLHLPVTVVIERREIVRSFWTAPSWYLSGVLVGDGLASMQSGTVVRESDERAERAWSGFKVTLYRDACERYWHALIGDKPKVYVVCRETSAGDDESGIADIEPIVVTIDYDEATAYAETDELVLSREIPGELYRHMEAFVLQHYKPKPFKKRKRKVWADGEPAHRRLDA